MNDSRPNIVLITTDQQRADSLSCYGSVFTHTPHLDRLAREGIRFDRAYCANSVCTPARASLFSGRYISRHGVWNVGMNVPDDERLLSHHLAAAGYATHYVGKAHFQAFGGTAEQSAEARRDNPRYPAFQGPYYGFESIELALGHTTLGLLGHYGEWVRSQVSAEEFASFGHATRLSSAPFGCEAYDWTMPLRFHNSVWTADRAIQFLRQQPGDKPFLLAVGFQDPHHPHCVPIEFDDRVDPERIPPPSYVDGELGDKPPHFGEARTGRLEQSEIRGRFFIAGQGPGFDFRNVSEPDARLGRAYYYNMVRLIDREMGRILACLDATGLAENTFVIFTTDHGELLGDHGLWMKGPFHYEPLIRVPLLMRWPKGFDGARALSSLISHVDVVPTLLAAARLELDRSSFDGHNALPLLRGEAAYLRDAALIECVDDPDGLRLKTLVTGDRKLTWYSGKPYGELFDFDRDPDERRNLWDHADSLHDRARLLARLLTEMETLEKRAPRYSYA